MSEQSFDAQKFKNEQRRDWDAAAAGWKKWWPSFEGATQHVSDRIVELAAIKAGDRVLDIATGNGEPAVTAARRVGAAGRVVATDQSPGMLAISRERATGLGLSNLDFRESDGESLAISDRDFNAVICRWGLMFMPDLPGALKGLRDRLVRGGHFATSVWSTPDKVPMITLAADEVRKIAGLPTPPPGAFDPLRLADTSILKSALEQADFKDIAIERVDVTFEFESAAAFTQFREDIAAPFRALLERQTPEIRRQILDAVTEAARAYADSTGKVRTTNEAILFAAHL
jgi:SAM-dependent methyltransferase